MLIKEHMEIVTKIMTNTPAHFEQIDSGLRIESGTPDFSLALEFSAALTAAITVTQPADDPRLGTRLEEALVWRILARRMVRDLSAAEFSSSPDKKTASSAAAYRGIDTLAKTYERLRRVMDELTPPTQTDTAESATGLPMRMLKVLEETEGFLENALGLKPGEKCAFSPKLRRNDNSRGGNPV
jgi:hypothetical protein